MKTVIFGGGCFWCTEAMFTELRGVEKVESGYSGGQLKNPTYKEVCSGHTGHAEVIRIEYNPNEISFRDLIEIHLSSHDPTTLNRQGNDIGTQYRSIIFYTNEEEKQIATEVIAEMQSAFDNKIVTEIAPFDVFYLAEEEHQKYVERSGGGNGYCQVVVNPKLKKFKEKFASKLK